MIKKNQSTDYMPYSLSKYSLSCNLTINPATFIIEVPVSSQKSVNGYVQCNMCVTCRDIDIVSCIYKFPIKVWNGCDGAVFFAFCFILSSYIDWLLFNVKWVVFITHTLQPAIWTTYVIGNSDHVYVTRNDR